MSSVIESRTASIPDLRAAPDCWLPVYKWVTGSWTSPTAPRIGRVDYGRRPTESLAGCGPLTAFLTERQARIWAHSEAYEALRPGTYLLARGQAHAVSARTVWVPGWRRRSITDLPPGTILADRVILTRVLDQLTVAE